MTFAPLHSIKENNSKLKEGRIKLKLESEEMLTTKAKIKESELQIECQKLKNEVADAPNGDSSEMKQMMVNMQKQMESWNAMWSQCAEGDNAEEVDVNAHDSVSQQVANDVVATDPRGSGNGVTKEMKLTTRLSAPAKAGDLIIQTGFVGDGLLPSSRIFQPNVVL